MSQYIQNKNPIATVAELVVCAQRGDRGAMGELFNRYRQHVMTIAYCRLGDENESQDDSLGEVIFPKGFEVRDLENLRKEFEILANRYGLSLPAKLKKGNLVLEWKPLPGEIQNNTEKKFGKVKLKPKVSNLTTEELIAFSESFVNIQKN